MIRSKRQIDDLRHSAVPALCTMSVSCGSMHLATGYKYDLLRPALSGSRNLLSQGRTYSTYGSSPKKAVLHLTCQVGAGCFGCRCSTLLIGKLIGFTLWLTWPCPA